MRKLLIAICALVAGCQATRPQIEATIDLKDDSRGHSKPRLTLKINLDRP